MSREIELGLTGYGDRVTANIELHERDARRRETVDHEITDEPIIELGIYASVYEAYRRNGKPMRRWKDEPMRAGQSREAVLEVTTPAGEWTLEELRDLYETWNRWHLNDVKAGCVHQTKIIRCQTNYGNQIDLDATTAANDCPAGYKYGSKWLYEPLPAEVIDKIRRWQRR